MSTLWCGCPYGFPSPHEIEQTSGAMAATNGVEDDVNEPWWLTLYTSTSPITGPTIDSTFAEPLPPPVRSPQIASW